MLIHPLQQCLAAGPMHGHGNEFHPHVRPLLEVQLHAGVFVYVLVAVVGNESVADAESGLGGDFVDFSGAEVGQEFFLKRN